MCVYALIIEVKWVYDVYQYIFPHRESMCCVSIIYSLSTPPHSELSAEECHPDLRALAIHPTKVSHGKALVRMSAMLRLVGTWCILMSPFCKWSWSHLILRSTCLVLEFPGLMLFVHIAIVERLSSNMLTPCCGDPMLSNILMVWRTDLTQLTKLSSSVSVVDRAIVRCRLLFHVRGPLL